jgi:type I restriction enzyme M protein
MDSSQHNAIVSFIWGTADDILRDVYVRGKYRDVILPMTVIRRLDAILEPTKQEVLRMKEHLDKAGISNQYSALCKVSGQAFFNTSRYTLRDLKARAKQQQLQADFEDYLNGFSPNVQEIIDNFLFRTQIEKLVKADILGYLIERFLDTNLNLSPLPVFDSDGRERQPGLDNHSMGTIFEELIRRFNEENNEEAGEHWTPRDVVKLMADMMFLPIADQIEDAPYLVYDGACGTGGMLTVAENRLQELAQEHGKSVTIHLYGQEINSETYAIAKSDLLIKGEKAGAENLRLGSTLSGDGFPTMQFDFMLSNPPYGKSWKTDLDRMGGKGDLKDPRFVVTHGGDSEYSMITRSSDGQLMFLANMLSKMKHDSKLGSRIAEVHNGSSLFTGDAGQGETNIRRWIIENDWLEAIIALPQNIFYNTGIATYIWVLTNRKAEHRKGKVQLIDASNWYSPLRKNQGKKNCELSEEHIRMICDTLIDFKESEQSKIFPNEAFGYWKITVERPLRLAVDLRLGRITRLSTTCEKAKESSLPELMKNIAGEIGVGPHFDYNAVIATCREAAEHSGTRLTAKREKLIQTELCDVEPLAEFVIKKIHPKATAANPFHGLFDVLIDGKPRVVEYEPDTNLRDTEQIPLLEDGGIEAFFKREVLPYAPNAWIDLGKTQIGYEISFTRYFYKPVAMRTLEEIVADIKALEQETDGLLEQIIRVGE